MQFSVNITILPVVDHILDLELGRADLMVPGAGDDLDLAAGHWEAVSLVVTSELDGGSS